MICSEMGVPDVKYCSFVSSSDILVPLGFSLFRGFYVFGTNFSCSDEIRSLPQSLNQGSFLQLSQGEFEPFIL